MTRFQALFVKYCRVRLDGSWRWVAGKWDMRYKKGLPFSEEMTFGGNQIDGLELCKKAMEILDCKDPNWN